MRYAAITSIQDFMKRFSDEERKSSGEGICSDVSFAKYVLGNEQTNDSLENRVKYIELLAKAAATLCSVTATGSTPTNLSRYKYATQMANKEWKIGHGIDMATLAAQAKYFGRMDFPASAIYDRVLHIIFPQDKIDTLLQESSAAGVSDLVWFALYDGKMAICFRVEMEIFAAKKDWPMSNISVCASVVQTKYSVQAVSNEMKAFMEKAIPYSQ
jgi:hypothetical protein